MANELIIAGAGSGKTTKIVLKALEIKEQPVLITTYTESNEFEIKSKFIKLVGYVPRNVTIQTWFSLLIQHGVKPYQSYLYQKQVRGLLLVSEQSGFRYMIKGKIPVYFDEDTHFEKHYFSTEGKIYSDKLSKFVYRVNNKSAGKVIDRLARIYPNIFIDEAQDLAGYDLLIIMMLSESTSKLLLVCDPRQVTYLTHHERKFEKYKNGLLDKFLREECPESGFIIDEDTLSHSFRCNDYICNYSNKLYPNIRPCESAQDEKTQHDGIFLVRKEDCKEYLVNYKPIQLRWDIRTKGIEHSFPVYNFGLSKGLTFDRVLIYPTNEMLSWMKNNETYLSDQTRAKFYVALTRAKYSVGIVCDSYDGIKLEGIGVYK